MSVNNSEIIYQITKAIYQRLGEKADRQLVEALVSDIFIALQPTIEASTNSQPNNQTVEPPNATARFILSAFGLDRPGIVASVATILSQAHCSIIDMNQTVVQSKFAMIMVIEAHQSTQDMRQLREQFQQIGQQLGVRIYLQREDIFHAMHRV